MVNDLLGKSLDKSNSLRRSNWELELSNEQVRYAALDAFANSALFDEILARMTEGENSENFINVPRLLSEVALVPSSFPYYIEPEKKEGGEQHDEICEMCSS
jgi:ribonuclease D